jgi:protein CpxP
MLSFHRTMLMVAALSAGFGSVAVAQTPAPAATTAAVDQRVQLLQTQLGITPDEMPLWTAFAQAMRDNAASTEQLFQQRAGAAATMTAVDNMHSYASLARTYADDTAKLSVAFDSLYASLTPTQKQAADTLFRQQATAKTPARR